MSDAPKSAPPRRRSRGRRLLGLATALLVAASGLSLVAVAEQPASAVSATEILRSFDPADIISDAVMFNSSTMSASAIQTFLNGKVAECRAGYTCLRDYRQDTTSKAADPMCAAYTGAKDESAATIIFRVGKACGVNPQVLLVTLQKEQSLVQDSWPSARQYRSATGYGCPDTAPCDADYYGFFNQVYKAAWAFKRYTTPKGTEGPGWTKYNWFPVGRPSGVLFHPNAACGAQTITIQNKATAVLYYFTPYQPNTAALAAGFGIGNSCSAYGNRNFFLYFTSWFGSTHYAVSGAIATYWTKQKGAKGALGDPVQNAVAVDGGQVQRFEGGTVYSSAAGTVSVSGAIQAEYTAEGAQAGALGWPRKDVVTRKDNGGGSIQAFEHGSVFQSKAGAFAVPEPVYGQYGRVSFQAGALGWPRKDVVTRKDNGGGAIQAFEHGSVFQSKAGAFAVPEPVYGQYGRVSFQAGGLGWPTADAVESQAAGGGVYQAFQGGRVAVAKGHGTVVTGAVLAKWLQRGGESGSLGWPTADAGSVTSAGRTGTVQAFTTGRVIVLGKKVFTVTGDIARNWVSHQGPTGSLGWPTGAATSSTRNGGGWSQRFEKGAVFYSAASKAHLLNGKELALYDQRGGTEGSLGWPGTRVTSKAGIGGAITPFTNGTIYRSKAGTVAVLGDILARYTSKSGPAGVLGWPTTAARREKGLLTQRFEHGKITWTKAGGARASRKP